MVFGIRRFTPVLFVFAWSVAGCALAGEVHVLVESAGGVPVEGARVTLVELRLTGVTDAEGRYTFTGVPDGELHLMASNNRFGDAVAEIAVAADATSHKLVLGYSEHRERIVVTATRTGRGSGELVAPVKVLDGAALSESMASTLGETLAGEAGVSSSYFGPGASRPVIRGQGAGRVRVLDGGLGVGDASTTSPDHAVSTDALSAERIEILRGPATLLYGSSAIGGVVNVIDRRVPDHVPHEPVVGSLDLRYGTAAAEQSAAVNLTGGAAQFAWHLDALSRDTADVDVPGATLPNSSLESLGASVGASWVSRRGFVGLAAKGFDTSYGIPTEPVRIDLEQRRYDLRGGFDIDAGPLSGITFSVATTDYEHRELEGTEVGTTFFNDSDEARVEVSHGRTGTLKGVFGLQYGMRELAAVGDEAFLPPSQTDNVALFALQEIESGKWSYDVGARFETTEVRTPVTVAADPGCEAPRRRSFDTLSGSIGVGWAPNESYTVGGSLSRTVRPPGAEELYACGEHPATLSFEVGDPDLGDESTLGLDVTLRKRTGRVTGEVNLFGYRYDDYVYEFDAGQTSAGGSSIFRFTQEDAEFLGAELRALVELIHDEDNHLHLEIGSDYVEATLDRANEPLPRIPPLSAELGLRYRGASWYASAEVQRHASQDDRAPTETVTGGYTLVNATVGYRVAARHLVHEVMLRGTNLTDEVARNHASRLKDRVPLPGIDVSLVYRLFF